MPRTTPAQVRLIVKTRAGVDLVPFIETANSLVTERCAGHLKEDGTPFLSAARLELIERYLAAHFYQIMKPRTVQEMAGEVQATYQSKVDLLFNVTHYGQQALLLDTTGGLASLQAAVEDAKGELPLSGYGASGVFTGTPDPITDHQCGGCW